MRALAYARLSNTYQPDTIPAQYAAIEAWAAAEGYEIVERVADVIKGDRELDQRPGLAEAFDLIQQGKADALAVRGIDRLARALHVQEAIFAQIWVAGGRVWDTNGGGQEMLFDDPSDPYRTFFRQLLGATAQLERGLSTRRL